MCALARSSMMSLRRTVEPLMKYSLSPSRETTRSIVTSEKSKSKTRRSLSKTTLTDARLALGVSLDPFQMRSSPRLPRMLLILCSQRTKRKASATLLLPEPLGPTIAEIGVLKEKLPFLAKDLKPESSILLRYIENNYNRGQPPPFALSASCAAACSPSCLLFPSPSPTTSFPTYTTTVKCLL